VPEGDTLFRTAAVLRDVLLGRTVSAARARPGGAQMGRVVGSRIDRVDAQGKHLLIGFDTGATLHTHLRMSGSWHRYRPGERWRRGPSRAVCVIEVPNAVAVCFDAPVVELLETRALAIHPVLAALGPDLSDASPDMGTAVRRLRASERRAVPIGDALLDQRALAGLGNVYRSELCFMERVDPFLPMGQVDHRRTTTPDALGAPPGSTGPGTAVTRRDGDRLWVYGRTDRPCRRCGTLVRSAVTGELPRRVWWCPTCQPAGAGGDVTGTGSESTVAVAPPPMPSIDRR
jgi:endonuclease-8